VGLALGLELGLALEPALAPGLVLVLALVPVPGLVLHRQPSSRLTTIPTCLAIFSFSSKTPSFRFWSSTATPFTYINITSCGSFNQPTSFLLAAIHLIYSNW